MHGPPRDDITLALVTLTDGDEAAAKRLLDLVYAELRALAGRYFASQRRDHTLQPTALVHEAFVKVAANTGAEYTERAHFFAVCASAMRSILADHARRRRAAKRGGDWQRITLADISTPTPGPLVDVLALDEVLTQLAERSARQARIVEYRFFAGMTVDEVAQVLDVSRSTVEDDWRMARAWLTVQLRKGETP